MRSHVGMCTTTRTSFSGRDVLEDDDEVADCLLVVEPLSLTGACATVVLVEPACTCAVLVEPPPDVDRRSALVEAPMVPIDTEVSFRCIVVVDMLLVFRADLQ